MKRFLKTLLLFNYELKNTLFFKLIFGIFYQNSLQLGREMIKEE